MAELHPRRSPRPSGEGLTGFSFERRVLLGGLAIALPMTLLCGVLLWRSGSSGLAWSVFALALAATLILATRLRHQVVYPLYTLSNLLEALREGDYSLRGSRGSRRDAIGDVVWEVNTLSQTLRDQRLKVEETSALLGKVIAAIDIGLFSFDDEHRLRLINRAGERLISQRAGAALGRPASALGLDDLLAIDGSATLKRAFGGSSGRWDVRRFTVREGGKPHDLLVVTDLSRALREEERQAWQRLIRVLGHELNNSLAPIKSMAGTLSSMLAVRPLPEDWSEDAEHGLRVIGDRADALGRFMVGYSTLARLPPPRRQPVELEPLLRRVVALEQRLPVQLGDGPALTISLDPDQIEQALINLVKNAVEASLPQHGAVALRWSGGGESVRIEVLDEGLGLSSSDNLFVPFFTTKPGGSGIGLVLARQIVEAHGGALTLEDRRDRRGCVARIELPLQ
ncbi:sensor histidine kinase [Chiayiivirga flava]|uniref:histidine kinase n=1 Tax=Chiayiivirga flava TaxID=659595 RepID=A0A7W8D830_9GAMM|nr:ATP-binding protein [Chiayiivirga flava]MBB5208487.1 nitrogen fixation/metabolism regulation signal transduction histidine kinase [Chiayiivirga flava]